MACNNAKCKKQEIMFNIDATYQKAAEVLAGFESSITVGNHLAVSENVIYDSTVPPSLIQVRIFFFDLILYIIPHRFI